MNEPLIVTIAQVTGAISILLLFILKLFIAVHLPSFRKSGRIAILWTSVYVLFLFGVRILSLFDLATRDQLRVISGFSSLIPLFAVALHLFFAKKMDGTPPLPTL